MRLLLDQNAPRPLAHHLGHDVTRVVELCWDALVNGDLIAVAEAAGFEVLVTGDKNWRYQQNLSGRTIGIVVLPTALCPDLRDHVAEIAAAVGRASAGTYEEVVLPRRVLKRRTPPEPCR